VTLRDVLVSTTQSLLRAGFADAPIEAELLLGHILGMSKTQLYTQPEKVLTSRETEELRRLVERRLAHEPIAYILGHCEFYGIDFYIDSRAFIPRPETELLVEKAVELGRRIYQRGNEFTIADIGTGCGAIAISLALALPEARIYATDISASALQVAKVNCERHGVNSRVELLQGNLLEPLPEPVNMIVANLPYVADCEFAALSPEIREYEPTVALAGGKDGLDRLRQMLEQVPGKLNQRGCLVLEIGEGQGNRVSSLIKDSFPEADVQLFCDLAGIERVAVAIFEETENARDRSAGAVSRRV